MKFEKHIYSFLKRCFNEVHEKFHQHENCLLNLINLAKLTIHSEDILINLEEKIHFIRQNILKAKSLSKENLYICIFVNYKNKI